MTIPRVRWRKSTYSSVNNDCVELPHTLDAVRDTKNGAILRLSQRAVSVLLATVKQN